VISQTKKKLVGFAFVDDTDLCVYGPHVSSSNVCESMQQSVDQWEGLLRAMGGTLVPTKCFWYLINFQWRNNAWQYVSSTQSPRALAIKDDSQQRVPIPHLETHEAQRTLGVHLAPDGNWDTEGNYLLSVTSDWKTRMAASRLSPADATFSLKHVIMQKLAYLLVTTTFSQHQCYQIMAPILQQGQPKAGVVQTFP